MLANICTLTLYFHLLSLTDEDTLTRLSPASHKGSLANSVDPDQTPQNAASDRGLHCLHLINEFL